MHRIGFTALCMVALACQPDQVVRPTDTRADAKATVGSVGEHTAALASQAVYGLHRLSPDEFTGGRVTVYDAGTMSPVTEIPLPAQFPTHMVLSKDGQIGYVVMLLENRGPGLVARVDIEEGRVIGTVPLGGTPFDIAITPDGHLLFVTLFDGQAVAAIDAQTFRIRETISLTEGSGPSGIVISPDGGMAWVGSQGSNLIHEIGIRSLQVERIVETGYPSPARLAYARGTKSLVALIGSARKVLMLNPKTLEIDTEYSVPDCASPSGIVFPASGRQAFLACRGSDMMGVLNLKTGDWEGSVEVPGRPSRIYLDRTGKYAALFRRQVGGAAVIDLNSLEIIAESETGSFALGGAVGKEIRRLPPRHAARVVEIRDLGTLRGSESRATGINETGQVVGEGGGTFLWDPSHPSSLLEIDLSSLADPPHQSLGWDINDAGEVVGLYWIQGQEHDLPYFWPGSDPPIPFGGPQVRPWGLNNLGQVVGHIGPIDDAAHAFIWDRSMEAPQLLPDGGARESAAEGGVNDAGQIAGYAWMFDDWLGEIKVVVRWESSDVVPTSFGFLGEGFGINQLGQVVGHTQWTPDQFHAFVWTEGSGMRDLGFLPGHQQGIATDINDRGQVVGWSRSIPDGDLHGWGHDVKPFFWDPRTGMVELGTLGGETGAANAINENGWVVGWSETQSGDLHATLWKIIVGN